MFEGSNIGQEGPNEDARKFYKFVEEGKKELYPGCKNFSILSFIIRIFLYKTVHGLSNVGIDDLLILFKNVIPDGNFPLNFNKAKKIVRFRP